MNNLHRRSFGLDFTRALAIILVVASHFGHTAFGTLGFWGVELFFGLSGFLIGQILWRNFSKTDSWSFRRIFNFWSRRWWRTLPNYYLFFLFAIFIAYINNQGIPSFAKLTDYLWFGQSLTSFSWGFYVVAWSLCVEEWFYFLFPLVLFGFSKTKLSHRGKFSGALAFFFLGSIVMRYVLINYGAGDSLRTITLSRLDSIASGVLLAFTLAVFDPKLIWKKVGFVVGICFAISPFIYVMTSNKNFDEIIQNPILLLIVPFGFSLTLPIMDRLKEPLIGKKAISVIVRNLSLWSYSIYLSHLTIMWEVYYIMNRYRSNIYVNFSSKLIGLVIVLFVSSLLFKYFEKPLTAKRPEEIK